MKLLHYLLLAVFLPLYGYTQTIAVENDKQNNIFLGVCNPFTVAVEGCSSKSIFLTTNNGSIEGAHGHYILCPKKDTTTTVYIHRKTQKGTIVLGQRHFSVKRQAVDRSFAGMGGGIISPQTVWLQISPTITMELLCGRYPVDSFKILVVRNKENIFYRKELTRIDDSTKDFFRKMVTGDRLIIKEIAYKDFDGAVRYADPMEFTIEGSGKDIPPDPVQLEYVEDPVTGEMVKNPRWKPLKW